MSQRPEVELNSSLCEHHYRRREELTRFVYPGNFSENGGGPGVPGMALLLGLSFDTALDDNGIQRVRALLAGKKIRQPKKGRGMLLRMSQLACRSFEYAYSTGLWRARRLFS